MVKMVRFSVCFENRTNSIYCLTDWIWEQEEEASRVAVRFEPKHGRMELV